MLPSSSPAPVGLDTPTVEYISNGIVFSWALPTQPNGLITHYILYVGGFVVFNGSALSHTIGTNLQGTQPFFLEAYNTAGSARYALIFI